MDHAAEDMRPQLRDYQQRDDKWQQIKGASAQAGVPYRHSARCPAAKNVLSLR